MWFRISLASIWYGIIWYLSSIPGLASGYQPETDFVLRKFAHVGVFFILGILVVFIFMKLKDFKKFQNYYLAVTTFIVLNLAIIDEIHQVFVPLREGKIFDVGIDVIGIALSLIFAKIVLSTYLVNHK